MVTQRLRKAFDLPAPKPVDMTHQDDFEGCVAWVHTPNNRNTISIQAKDPLDMTHQNGSVSFRRNKAENHSQRFPKISNHSYYFIEDYNLFIE